MSKKSLISEGLLIIVVIIWGMGFVFQSIAGKQIDVYSLTLVRNLFSTIFLGLVIIVFYLWNKKKHKELPKIVNKKKMIIGGVLIGLSLSGAMIFQQLGINDEGAGKSGFLTALYIVFVPIISLFFHKRISPLMAIAIVLGVTGLYLINYTDGSFTLSKGTILLLLCALFYSFQILLIDYFAKYYPPLYLSFIQFITATIVSIPFVFTLGSFNIPDFVNSLPSTLFLGVCSSGIAYTLQIVAQKNVNASVASITMSLESIFSLLFGMWILGESHGLIELGGCFALLFAVLLAQLNIPIHFHKIKVVFLDLDWTLFDHHSLSYPSEALEAVAKLREKGIKVIINTSRCYSSLSVIHALEEVPHDGYICSNGGIAFVDNQYLYKYSIPNDTAKEIITYASRNNYLLQLITPNDSFLINEENDLSKEYYADWLEYHPEVRSYNEEEITSIVLFDNEGKEEQFVQFGVSLYRYYKNCVDLTPIDYHKGLGVKAVLEHYGYHKYNALAVGDGLADIDMFKQVRYCVAMGNANEKVKQRASYVTSNIENNGLVNAFKKYKLI